MKLNKEKFLKTELGAELDSCIKAWDYYLNKLHTGDTQEQKEMQKGATWCQAQWEVYKMAIKQFYGIEYFFTRTEEYFGVVTEDETDWLIKIERNTCEGGQL